MDLTLNSYFNINIKIEITVKNATNITELAAAVGLKNPVLGLVLAEIGVDLNFPLSSLGESSVQEVEVIMDAVKIPAADGSSTPASLNLGHKVAVRSFFKETRERACPAAAIPQQLTATSSVQPQPGCCGRRGATDTP